MPHNLPVVVEGSDLPGRSCHPDAGGDGYSNVHVGLCDRSWKGPPSVEPSRPWGVRDLVAGDARTARWEFEMVVREKDGVVDFGGPLVRGNRDDRHIALFWGEMPSPELFRIFRGIKLRLDQLDIDILARLGEPGHRLVARLGLTDGKGNPRAASVKPPDIVWSLEKF